MNVNHLYFLFEENMMKSLKDIWVYIFVKIPEIFPSKTPDLEYVNFATPCITFHHPQPLY
jgi:hypothetical protein